MKLPAASRSPLPGFVRRELGDYLRCGILAHGFCRVHCAQCGENELVAFSCKRRGFCPSCGARRMADLAAHLVDSVLPDVPVRQWVLSLPHRVRLLCAYDPVACAIVRRVFVRAVSGFYLRRARQSELPRASAGAVVFAQRFDSGLRLNLHFHGLWLDGAFACPLGGGRARFDPHGEVTDHDVERAVRAIRSRVLRALRMRGKLPADGAAADESPDDDPSLLLHLGAAAIEGRTALGNRRGAHDLRPGRGSRQEPFRRGPLCSDLDGFSLHAAVRIPAGCRERLEKLCRYAARPPIVAERLSLLPDGRVSYRLKKRYRDGSTHVVLDPLTFLERLCALVPRPRRMMLTYHGVLAPAAGMRDRVVPPPPLPEDDDCVEGDSGCDHGAHRERRRPQPPSSTHGVGEASGQPLDNDPLRRSRELSIPHAPTKNRRPRKRHSWADLLRRVYLIDVLTCPSCQGRRTLLAAIHDPDSIRRILHHLGLPAEPPAVTPARPPPQARLPW